MDLTDKVHDSIHEEENLCSQRPICQCLLSYSGFLRVTESLSLTFCAKIMKRQSSQRLLKFCCIVECENNNYLKLKIFVLTQKSILFHDPQKTTLSLLLLVCRRMRTDGNSSVCRPEKESVQVISLYLSSRSRRIVAERKYFLELWLYYGTSLMW